MYLAFALFLFLLILTHRIVENFHENKYTAVMIEPREHPAMEFVLKNFNDHLSDEWKFVVFHGTKNKEYTKSICEKVFKPDRIKLVNLGVENLTISEYSSLFYKDILYSNIPTETFLIFQTDSIICGKYKDQIQQFLEYDYVGAPWAHDHVKGPGKNIRVGNGGLSLRKKSKMKEIVEKCNHIKEGNHYISEDFIFSNGCGIVDLYKPTEDQAKLFSIEETYHDQSFGLHKAYEHLDTDQIKEWCPEVIRLKELNGR
jgi:hypothetical protein